MSYFHTVVNAYNVNMGRLEVIPAIELRKQADLTDYMKKINSPDRIIKNDFYNDFKKQLDWRNENQDDWLCMEYEKMIDRDCYDNSDFNSILMPIYCASEYGCNSKLMFFDFNFAVDYAEKIYQNTECMDRQICRIIDNVDDFYSLLENFQNEYNFAKNTAIKNGYDEDKIKMYVNEISEECMEDIYNFVGYADSWKWRELLYAFKELIFNGYTVSRVGLEEIEIEASRIRNNNGNAEFVGIG